MAGRRWLKVSRDDVSRLMAASLLQLEFGLSGSAVTTGWLQMCALRLMQGLAPETGGHEALSQAAVEVKSYASYREEEGAPPEGLQEFLWQQLFADPTQWWDNRRSKSSAQHPDFKHKKSKVGLWLNNRHKPPWVDSQVANWDAGIKSPPGSDSVPSHEGHLELARCRKLCEDGRTTDAVDALQLLVQQGCYVPNNLFYRALKGCEDLVLGRRVHALTVHGGHEGDGFLATHLIGLYASHGRLDEASRVFAKVSTPDAYNWATIIFAYAKHGEAEEAIRLYRQMLDSTVKPTDCVYLAVLKACGAAGHLVAGKEVHAHILSSPGKSHISVQASLIDMYAKCRSLHDARSVFDKIPGRNVVTWTAMIAGYAKHGMGQHALELYNSMQQEGITRPNSVTFVCLLQACASVGVGAINHGKKLHADIEVRGLQDDVVLGGSLVSMYVKCGSLEDARRTFDKLPAKNVVSWTAMIAGYAQQGMSQEALSLYGSMQQEGINPPNSVTFVCLLQACASAGFGALDQGKHLHGQIEGLGLQNDIVIGGSLVNMYAKCSSLEDARTLFDGLPEKNVVTWTAMIAGYAHHGMGQEALSVYSRMQQTLLTPPDSVTYVCLLQACASAGVGALDLGKQLHSQIEERGLQDEAVVGGSLVNMYAKCHSLEAARGVFDRLPVRSVVTWNAMIGGYAQQEMGQEALNLYGSMQQEGLTPDSVSFVCLLQGCASVGAGALDQGHQLHAQVKDRGLQDDMELGASLINMYAKCGSLYDARRVFDRLPARNVVTWTAMIAGYAQQEMGEEALGLYAIMQEEGITTPNCVTFVCLLQSCAGVGVGALHQGKQLHARIEKQGLQSDVVVGGSLVNMYARCGSLEDARSMFDQLPEKQVATWNVMLAGYAQHGLGQEALNLYSTMQEGINPPDSVTFVCLLQACTTVAAPALGKQLHEQIERQGLQADVVVGAALVNMYAKFGSMFVAQQVFDSLIERTVGAWGALIDGYARQGDSEIVFDLVERMKVDGIQPDGITFLSVLTLCTHVGLVDKGLQYFEAMRTEYGNSPTMEHYACILDLLGRAGYLDDALEMAKSIPFQPSAVVWLTLLGACQKWKNVKIGQQAFEFAAKLDGKDPSSYVLMSNIYASADMWEEAQAMQARRVKSGAWKKPGQSWWTDMGGLLHTFVVGDKKHLGAEGIYAKLEQLLPEINKERHLALLHSAT